jgi:hypothetical protein
MPDFSNLTSHLFLWHLTPRAKADRIAVEGFLPKGPARQNHVSRAIWFASSGFSFTERVNNTNQRDIYDAFLVALPVALLDRSWNGQVADEFMAFQPLPPEIILARIPANRAVDRDTLLAVLRESLGGDPIDQLATLCTREDIPWSQRTSPAAALMYLDRSRYEEENLSARAFRDSFPTLSLPECVTLAQSAATIDFRFYHYFLRQYYFTYGERHVARAILTAAARRIGIDRVVSLCCDRSSDPGHNLVSRFLADLLPHFPKRDLVFALIELRAVRPYRESEDVTNRLENWILEQPESIELAPWFIEHAHDLFHARTCNTAIDLAITILRKLDGDPFDTLRELGRSPFPDVRRGVVHAIGVLSEERSLPYLEQCLDTDWKAMREETVKALGRLESDRARQLVTDATQDRAGRVRRAAEQTLANM